MARIIAWDREETDPCEAGTPGCAIAHDAETLASLYNGRRAVEGTCETW